MAAQKVVWINDFSFQFILEEMSRWYPKETGGILMGYRNKSNDWVITQIIGPGPNAEHKRYSFIPDYEFHEKEVAKIYEASECLETYLGDWHTHPDAAAYLSGKDWYTLKNIAKSKEARNKEPLMLILGTRPLALKAWSHQPKAIISDNICNRPINLLK